MKRVIIFVLIIIAVSFTPVSAIIIDVPNDYPTIQQGINASINGDTVLVHPGVYIENINFNGHNIVLGSLFLTTEDTLYISTTIIDGGSSGTVVTFESGEDNLAIIVGFTIRSGNQLRGGGIACWNSSPTIMNNVIKNNNAHPDENWNGLGGGIYCYQSNPAIINNTICENTAFYYGGGIHCSISNPVISYNVIWGNSAISGGGVYCDNSNPTMHNNTVCGNMSEDSGGGIYCMFVSNPIVTNTIFWANSALFSPEIDFDDSSSPVFTYCDIQGGWPGEGNINCDPMFCDPDNGDYYLDANSCCVGAGEGGVDIGALGVGCGQPIPTLSEWGLIILALLLLATGTVSIIRSRRNILSEENN